MTLEQSLISVRDKIVATPAILRNIYSAKLAIEAAQAKLTTEGIAGIFWQMEGCFPQCDAEAGADKLLGWLRLNGGKELSLLAHLDAAAVAIANHPQHDDAVALLKPLCQERDRLEQAIVDELEAHRNAEAVAGEAYRTALDRAALAAENDPQVVAARRALAKFEDPPFRGRVKIESA